MRFSLSGLFFLLMSPAALARPEYAVKQNSSCTACHVSPWGGGPKTVYGKFYGSRDYPMAKTSSSDLYSVSVREIAYYPNSPSTTANGLALMEASASGNVPVIQNEDGTEFRLVGTYNASPVGSGAREVYFRWKPTSDENAPLAYLTVGRFNAPFGLLTDEHRTYVRIQTNMSLNSFENGALFGRHGGRCSNSL